MNFKKVSFNTEEDDTPKFESVFTDLPDCVKTHYWETVDEIKDKIMSAINNCESPIEQLLAIELHEIVNSSRLWKLDLDAVDVRNQDEIKIGDKEYRVDFCIPVYDMKNGIGRMFIVECDGHEFHQKTKEQVQHDYERTRLFQSQGYVVIKFTGSEIYNSYRRCVGEIETIIINNFRSSR